MKQQQSREVKEFNRLYKELDDIYHEISVKAGLSDSTFLILYALADFGSGCLQKDIADSYSVSRQTINSAIKKLESQGYLTLTRGHGRDMHLSLTEAGEALVKEKIYPVIMMENYVFEKMPPEERQSMLQLTRKYVATYRKIAADLKQI